MIWKPLEITWECLEDLGRVWDMILFSKASSLYSQRLGVPVPKDKINCTHKPIALLSQNIVV